ncbi:MAG: ComEC/Rec2 family competence protein [Candidatus Rariloculaceae bacterium]
MMKRLNMCVVLALGCFALSIQAQQDTLDIYWIDADGGAATLIVTPAGESVLMDAGYSLPDDRHAKRIVAAMADAGIESLDYFIASHFHGDHVGGVLALAELVEIGEFVDHGESVEKESERGRPAWEGYQEALKLATRRSSSAVRPGDILPLRGVDLTIVVSNGEVPLQPMNPQGSNLLCQDADPGPEDAGENSRSVGYIVTLGDFEFLNLGDLTLGGQHVLACPENLVGVVDLMQIPHHGNSVAPQLMSALEPTVAVSSTGARKGGSPEGYMVMANVPGIEGIWQLHRALGTDDQHNTSEPMIANLDENEDAGYWIKAEVRSDGGSYRIINGRNQHHETYTTK